MAFLKIISFSLWGSQTKYTIGAIENSKLANEIYPGWICRFYVGKSTFTEAPDIIAQLERMNNVQIVSMDEEGDWSGMFWRFLACSDLEVDIVLSRDCDSRLSKRESLAVDEWLNSDKPFHIMRDHPLHDCNILGGMWGTRTHIMRDMNSKVSAFSKGNYWQIDQEFLSKIIFPFVKDESFIHDEFYGGHPFPSKRTNYEFVGEVYDENNLRNPEHWKILKKHLKSKKKWFDISKYF